MLPPELAQIIVELLDNSPKDLSTCALLGRTFLPWCHAARSGSFSSITLQRPKQYVSFLSLLNDSVRSSSTFPGCVTRLRLVNLQDIENASGPGEIIERILDHLPNISELNLLGDEVNCRGVLWSSLNPRARDALQKAFGAPKLESLTLDLWREWRPVMDLCPLPKLHHLTVFLASLDLPHPPNPEITGLTPKTLRICPGARAPPSNQTTPFTPTELGGFLELEELRGLGVSIGASGTFPGPWLQTSCFASLVNLAYDPGPHWPAGEFFLM